MKKILVPTDFSKCSSNALEVAVNLAKQFSAELFLLHLERVMSVVHASGSTEEEHVRSNRNLLFNLAEEAEKSGLHVHAIFVEDSGLETIEDYISPYGIDLIVMGSHGQSGIREQVIGSNTRRLVRKVNVPVLVIKTLRNSGIRFSKILFASTYRSNVKEQCLCLRDFARITNAQVHFLFLNLFYHLIHEEQINKLMDEHLEKFQGIQTFKSIAETNDELLGVSEFIMEVPVDLIAAVMEHPGIPARWLSPPLAERLIQELNLPVLILPANLHGPE